MIKTDCVFYYNDNVDGMNVHCCYGHCGSFHNCIGCKHYMNIKDTWEFSSVLNLPPVAVNDNVTGKMAGDALRMLLPLIGQSASMATDTMRVMNKNMGETIEAMMAEMEKEHAE